MKNFFIILLCLVTLAGCKGTQSTTTNTEEQSVAFSDDLSNFIVPEPVAVYEAPKTSEPKSAAKGVTVHDTERINSKVDAMVEHNQTVKWIDGYRLLIYSGINRKRAEEIQEELADGLFGPAFLRYEQPNYKIFLGEYFTQFDAQIAHAKIKPFYEASIIVTDRIAINR
jgi:hypothetical protein